MQRLQTGDEVVITAGKDKGKTGVVKSILENDRVVVDGVNIAKKHVKPNPNLGVQGGIEEIEMPLHSSNVMHRDKASGKPSRVGFKLSDDGKKVRYLKINGEIID
jgi:large subunit ribosomal protein L24